MLSVSELRELARASRQEADKTTNPETARMLREMARDYERRADELTINTDRER